MQSLEFITNWGWEIQQDGSPSDIRAKHEDLYSMIIDDGNCPSPMGALYHVYCGSGKIFEGRIETASEFDTVMKVLGFTKIITNKMQENKGEKTSLKEGLEDLKAQIEELKTRKKLMEEEILKSDEDFLTKLRIWAESEKKGHSDWLIDKEKNPLMRERFNALDPMRGKTYDLSDLIGCDDWELLIEPSTVTQSWFDNEQEYEEAVTKALQYNQPLLEEAMRTNIFSFECDW